MSYKADTELDLAGRTKSKYVISSQHRRAGNSNKCIWTISFDEEVDCFVLALTENWKVDHHAWSLKPFGQGLRVVGKNFDKQKLKLAKFVDSDRKDVWHGYPADYVTRSQDRPTTAILQAWVTKKYITKAKMSKIRSGHTCNL